MPSATLPPELWIFIVDLIIGALINPAESCSYKNFLEVDHYIRSPRLSSSVLPSYRELRLVCRAFNDLLKTPPRLFMGWVGTNIPAGTRALYIRGSDTLGCLHRLFDDPSRSHRIVTLDIPCDVVKDIHGLSLFEILVNNSDLLSGVRNLAFDVVHASEYLLDAHFWDRINRAYPALVCLVLRPSFKLGVVMLSAKVEEKRTVTFEKLKILEVNHVLLYNGLNFPLLRHVALGCCNQKVIEILARSPHLESVLLRKILDEENRETIDLSSLQKLRLLGIPVYGENTVIPLPSDYAYHLGVHVPSSITGLALVEWVKKVPSHFPKLRQIALDLTRLSWAQRIPIESAFRCINLELEPSGLVINHLRPGSSYVIIGRIVEQPKVSSTPQSEKSLDRWCDFRQIASRRLHL